MKRWLRLAILVSSGTTILLEIIRELSRIVNDYD